MNQNDLANDFAVIGCYIRFNGDYSFPDAGYLVLVWGLRYLQTAGFRQNKKVKLDRRYMAVFPLYIYMFEFQTILT